LVAKSYGSACGAARSVGGRGWLLASSALFALIAAGGASAQTVPGGGATTAPNKPAQGDTASATPSVGEVYVTARKREERLIDVPAAITAVSARAINRYGISDAKDLTQNVPNLMILPTATGSGGFISIRGIGAAASTADPGIAPEVAYNIDGVNITRGRVSSLGLLDPDHVEVLEGPQALYFGKNSPAGVVTIASVDPSQTLNGYVRTSYEFSLAAPELDAALTLPVNDTLSLRFALSLSEQRGYIRNSAVPVADPFGYAPLIDPGAVNKYQDGDNSEAGRISLIYKPNSRLTDVAKFMYSRYDANSEDANYETICAPGVNQVSINPGFGLPSFADPASTNCSNHPGTYEGGLNATLAAHYPYSNGGVPFALTTMDLLTNKLDYDFGNVTVSSITGYYNLHHQEFINASYSSAPFFEGGEEENYWQVSEEVRAVTAFHGPLNFMLGGYYESNKDQFLTSNYFVPLGPDTRNGDINSAIMNDVTPNQTYSVFGSADAKLPGNLELSAGARWTREDKVSTLENTFVNDRPQLLLGFPILQPEGVPIIAPTHDENVSPEVTLTWHVEPNFNVYGAFKTGYKSGGTSNAEALSPTTAAALSFLPETTMGGEFGAKGEWLDHRLQVTADVYSYDFHNLQVSSLTFLPDQPPTFHITNAASARSQGFETQGSFIVTDDLTVRANLSYNRATYVEFKNAPCTTDQTSNLAPGCVTDASGAQSQNLSGDTLPMSPNWYTGAGLTYKRPVGGGLVLSFDGDLEYNSGFVRAYGLEADGTQSAFVLLNAALKLAAPDKGWDVTLSARNLTDERVIYSAGNNPGTSGGVYDALLGPPREVTLRLAYSF